MNNTIFISGINEIAKIKVSWNKSEVAILKNYPNYPLHFISPSLYENPLLYLNYRVYLCLLLFFAKQEHVFSL